MFTAIPLFSNKSQTSVGGSALSFYPHYIIVSNFIKKSRGEHIKMNQT